MASDTTGPADPVEGLRRRWPLALLVAVPLFAGAVAYAESLPSTYSSTTVVTLTPRPDVDVGGDVLRVVVPKYVAYLDSRAVREAVAAETGAGASAVRNGVDVSVAPETANLEIVAELSSPEQAAAVAGELAAAAVTLSRGDRLLEADVLVPAVAVEKPSGPPRRLIEAGALLLALLAGVTLALVVDRSQPRLSTERQLSTSTGLRTLAALPRSRRLRQPPVEALHDPRVSAAVGRLLVQLDTESRLEPVRVLAVTSPAAGDGKTTVAAALATGLARLDARVLLLDADLRRPRLAAHLRLPPNGGGMAAVLQGDQPLSDAVIRHTPQNLFVLPTESHPDASNLLARRLRQVLVAARDDYDVVVVDCPPLLATDDALVVTVTCDAALLVVERGSRVSAVQAATSTMQGLKVRIIGTVLNRARGGLAGDQTYGTYVRR